MTYDLDQLNRDLKTIARRFGQRYQRGFFTESVYEDNLIRVVDRYIDPQGPEIYLKQNNNWVRLGKPFDTECWAGSRILSLVVSLEEML